MPFEIVRNDITRMQVDAIVNAANSSLLGGGGVDGAIHRAAGPELLEECKTLHGCGAGKAKITKGYRLPAKYVIHTVGPVWQGGSRGERELLVSCYRESLELATQYECESVAFPLISSGAYGYPKDQALKVASEAILEYLEDHDLHVYLVIFDRHSFLISSGLYANIQAFIDDSDIYPDYDREERRRRRLGNLQSILEAPMGAISPSRKEEATEESVCYGAGTAPDGLEEYVSHLDEGFRDMLLRKIAEKHLTDAECYKRANVDRKLFNKIKNQPDYKPGKSTVLALAISLKLPMKEIREMLGKAGFSLSPSSKFDRIVEFFILHGNYDIFEINEALFSFDQRLLGSVMN